MIPAAGPGHREPSGISQLAVTTIMINGACGDEGGKRLQSLSIGPRIERPTGHGR